MAIEVIIGNDLNAVSKATIRAIENSCSFELENFIVVPDRFSLLAEKEVFNELEISSTFNIKVLGISKLVSFFSDEVEIFSSDQSRLLIYSILLKNNFELFEPSIELSTQLFNIISQLKSSNVSAQQFEQSAATKKLKELSQIYSIYEQEKEGADQSDFLNNLINNPNFEKLSKCSFFFCGFDSLTAQGEKILELLILNAKRVVVGATAPSLQKNGHVYDADILNKLKRISKNNKIPILKTYLNSEGETLSSHILKNLFSFSPKKIETDKVKLLEFNTPEAEIKNIAKTILFYVKNRNNKFSDFNVLCASLEEFSSEFERIFNSYGIPYFIDNGTKINTLPIYSFFKNLFSYVLTSDEASFFNLLLNPYIAAPAEEISEFKNLVLISSNFNETLANGFDFISIIFEKINKFKELIKSANFNFEFAQAVLCAISIFNLEERNNFFIENFINTDLKSEKICRQIFKKLEIILTSLKLPTQTDFESFSKLFLFLFGEKEISSLPISVDCVFVGKEESFFESKKVMFVSNSKQGTLPKTISDLGLFSDDDISAVSLSVEPTVRMINKRNKQKLLFSLSQTKELIVSFSGSEIGERVEKSNIFAELQKIFTFNNAPLQILPECYSNFLPAKDFASFKIQTETDFIEELCKYKKQISREEFEKIINFTTQKDEKITFGSKLFYKFSPTELEAFFECPFKHFFLHGLKIKENPKNKFDARDFGNYFHIFAKEFVSRNFKRLGSLTDQEIYKQLCDIENLIKEQPRFKILSNNINNSHIFSLLKKEANLFLKAINHEQKYSNFLAEFFEQMFNLKLNDVTISGVVDRVDICGDQFRVVDYKSGEVKKSLRAIYSGLELQLFIYLIATKEKLGLKPTGAFYFPVGGDYEKQGASKKFKLDGFYLNNQAIIKNFDRRLGDKKESDIINIKLTQTSSFANLNLSVKKNVFSEEGLYSVMEYVKLLIASAEKQILGGFIEAKPILQYSCKNCPLFGICSFKQIENELFRKIGGELCEEDFIRIIKK